jgi:hypothetical protein
LQKWTGEERYASLQVPLEEMERKLVREALSAGLGFACFCEQEKRLEAEKLLEALTGPLAERVRDPEELSTRHEVEADSQGLKEYLVIMTEAWRRVLESG